MSLSKQTYRRRVLSIFLLRIAINPGSLSEKDYALDAQDRIGDMKEQLNGLLEALHAQSSSLVYRLLAFQAALYGDYNNTQQLQVDVETTLRVKGADKTLLASLPTDVLDQEIEQLELLKRLIKIRVNSTRQALNEFRGQVQPFQGQIKDLMTAHQSRSWGRRVLEFLGAARSSGALPAWILGGVGGSFLGMGVPAAIAAIAAGAAMPIIGAVCTAVFGAFLLVMGIVTGVRAFKRTEREIANVVKQGWLFEVLTQHEDNQHSPSTPSTSTKLLSQPSSEPQPQPQPVVLGLTDSSLFARRLPPSSASSASTPSLSSQMAWLDLAAEASSEPRRPRSPLSRSLSG